MEIPASMYPWFFWRFHAASSRPGPYPPGRRPSSFGWRSRFLSKIARLPRIDRSAPHLVDAPAHERELPRLTALGAYARVCGLFAVFFGVPFLNGLSADVLGGAGQSWLDDFAAPAPGLIAAGLWLAALARRRPAPLWQGLTGVGVAGFGVCVMPFTGPAAEAVVLTVLVAAEVLLVAAVAADAGIGPRDGLGLAPRWATGLAGYRQAAGVFVAAGMGLGASSLAMFALNRLTFLPQMDGSLLDRGQLDVLGYTGVRLAAIAVLAAPWEELIFTVAVVVFLSAARRPLWEIAAVAAVMRVSGHLYYETAVLGIAVLAVWNVWLYHRTRRPAPIIGAHLAVNLVFICTARFPLPVQMVTLLVIFEIAQLSKGLSHREPAGQDHKPPGRTADSVHAVGQGSPGPAR